MKTVMHIMMVVLLVGITTATKAGNPVWETKIKAPQITPRVFASTVIAAPAAPAATPAAAFDKCRHYKNKQIAGWILAPVGLGMMAGGGYMIYVGAKNIYDRTEVNLEVGVKTEVTRQDKIFLGVGAGMGFVGAILFPTGLAMAIKGGTNYNRDCRGGSTPARTLNFNPTGNGMSMVMKF